MEHHYKKIVSAWNSCPLTTRLWIYWSYFHISIFIINARKQRFTFRTSVICVPHGGTIRIENKWKECWGALFICCDGHVVHAAQSAQTCLRIRNLINKPRRYPPDPPTLSNYRTEQQPCGIFPSFKGMAAWISDVQLGRCRGNTLCVGKRSRHRRGKSSLVSQGGQ